MSPKDPPKPPSASPAAVVIGRVGTRRVSQKDLAETLKAEAAAAAAKVVVPPKPAELKVTSRLRLSQQQLAAIASIMKTRNLPEGEAVVLLGHASEDDVIAAEAELTSGRWMSKEQLEKIEKSAADALPEELCTNLQVMPIGVKNGTLVVAMRDPLDAWLLKRVEGAASRLKVIAVRAGKQALRQHIARIYAKIDEEDPNTWIER